MAREASNRRRISAWVLYDWANSAFTTVVVTWVYSTWFTQNMAADGVAGTAYWSRAIALSAILVALLSPVMGAIADQSGRRGRFLLGSTLLCVIATAALSFVAPSMPNAILLALAVFVVANVAFEVSGVFYNSYLPEISPPGKIGTISGIGWGVGYMAGIISLLLALFAFVGLPGIDPWLSIPRGDGLHVRSVNLMVAGWFLVFSIPTFVILRDRGEAKSDASVRAALGELRQSFRELGDYREMAKFLLARLVYNDGLVTIFAFGGIYAAGTFDMEFSQVIVFGISLNVVAGLGAFLFGFVDDRIGGKKTIMISLFALAAASLLAVWAPNITWFWVAGMLVGVFAGPNQAASRSLMGRFVPRRREAEFFGFFAFSGKLTSFAGPLLLGWATIQFGDQRAGVATVLIFFVLGAVLLSLVDEKAGLKAAREDSGATN